MISKLKKIRLYYFTLRHLKSKQIFFQLYYRLRKLMKMDGIDIPDQPPATIFLKLKDSIASSQSFKRGVFTFLNLEKKFEGDIDWNFNGYGKLWAYNLNYFDYLNQREIETKTALSLIDSYCEQPKQRREGCEPYPISLRGINWIKFFSRHNISSTTYSAHLYGHYKFLSSHLEYHLLGNHLLENGFSLLFGAYYFKDERFYAKAERILRSELKEQILNDGAHFELSPMYHQILLFRLLDCINLLQSNEWKNRMLLDLLEDKAQRMLGWLKAVTFANGEVPMVNDAAYNIAPSSEELFEYAMHLGLEIVDSKLSSSGYRVIRNNEFELVVDVGNIGPDYIPGHAHSDTLSFVLHVYGSPFIVDLGTSTYETSQQRSLERSTISHNTVIVNDREQSEVWGSFRVGRRARVTLLKESDSSIEAAHNGYKSIGVNHVRKWHWEKNQIVIVDTLAGNQARSLAALHFHPTVDVEQVGNSVKAGSVLIRFENASNFEIVDYKFPVGFNNHEKGKALLVHFQNKLTTSLQLQS